MWQALAKIVQVMLTMGSGWAVSDLFNEYQRSKQLNPEAKAGNVIQESFMANWKKWLWMGVSASLAYYLISLLFSNLKQRR